MASKKDYKVAIVNDGVGVTVDFTATEDESTILECGATPPLAIIIPSNFTESEITFLVSNSPTGEFVPLTNFDGSAYSVSGSASARIPLQTQQFCSVLYVKLQTTEVQASDCTVEFVLGPVWQGIHS